MELDPRNLQFLMETSTSYEALHRYPEAGELSARALAIAPRDYWVRILRASYARKERADLRPLRHELDAILAEEPKAAPEIADELFLCAILEHDRAAAEQALLAIPPEGVSLRSENFIRPREWFVGYAARTFGDAEAASAAFTATRDILERRLGEQPDYAPAWGLLGLVDAALGRKEEAIREGRRACELLPVSADAILGRRYLRNLARIYAWTGDKELALEQMAELPEPPSAFDYGELRLDPDWDSLRDDPRFEALLARVAPDAPETATPDVPEKSIAVLPFEDLSDNRDRSGFGAGIQEDLLTSLAQIHDLKVISRTSVMAYQKADGRNIRAIGRALGVAKLLEGTIRRAGNRVLVNVQLIDARNDRHVWAQRYDRTVADAIGLQGELATQIAAELKATLGPEEKARLSLEPTSNSEAYVLYLTALGKEDEIAAEQLYVQATVLDPKFALAYARASVLNSKIASSEQPRARKAKARAQAEEALRLAPTLGEAHMALGVCLYWGEKKYDAALQEFNLAAAGSPNNAEIYTYIGGIYRRQNRWRDAVASFDRAVSLDPRNAHVAFRAARNHLNTRNWVAAADGFNRALELEPNDVDIKILLAHVELYRNGNPAGGRRILENIPASLDSDGLVALTRWDMAMLERDYASAEKILSDHDREGSWPRFPKTFLQGRIALARGDIESAQRYFAAAAPALEAWAREDPDESEHHGELGLLYAYMHRKEDAIRESRRAVELEPESQDAFHGALWQANLALVYALVGEQDQAIPLIERLLSTPGPVDGLISRQTSPWQSCVCAGNGIRSEATRVSRKSSPGPEPKTIY